MNPEEDEKTALGSQSENPRKKKTNEENEREKSIGQALSPPLPQVQCISFDPETQVLNGGRERKGKEKSEK